MSKINSQPAISLVVSVYFLSVSSLANAQADFGAQELADYKLAAQELIEIYSKTEDIDEPQIVEQIELATEKLKAAELAIESAMIEVSALNDRGDPDPKHKLIERVEFIFSLSLIHISEPTRPY